MNKSGTANAEPQRISAIAASTESNTVTFAPVSALQSWDRMSAVL